jgi:hypothetical protein
MFLDFIIEWNSLNSSINSYLAATSIMEENKTESYLNSSASKTVLIFFKQSLTRATEELLILSPLKIIE